MSSRTHAGEKPVHHSLRDQGRMGFKQTIDQAVSAFLRHPSGKELDLSCFDPARNDLSRQQAVIAEFTAFLKEVA